MKNIFATALVFFISALTNAQDFPKPPDQIIDSSCPDCIGGQKGGLPKEYSLIRGMMDLGKGMASMLPGDLGKAYATYMEVMAPQNYESDAFLRGSNAGLLETNRALLKDQCTQRLLNKLYSEDEIHAPTGGKIAISDGVPSGTKPGWLWEKALAVSEGNPNLAMKLIGYCGHDDVSQTSYHSSSRFKCPDQTSKFYTRQALGERVDLPDSIRKYVIDKQSVHAEPKSIKAKNYHFMGSSLLGCRMLENGITKEKIPGYAQMGAYFYRRTAICRSAQDMVQGFKPLLDIYDKKLKEYNLDKSDKTPKPKLEDIFAVEADRLLKLEYKDQKAAWKDPLFIFLGPLRYKTDKTKAIERIIVSYYASKYYAIETQCPKGKAGEVGDALQMASLPKDVSTMNFVMGPRADQFNEKCLPEYCSKIQAHLMTWDADFKWTITQHAVGAEFGAAKCSANKEASSRMPQSCSQPLTESERELPRGQFKGIINPPVKPESAPAEKPQNVKTSQ